MSEINSLEAHIELCTSCRTGQLCGTLNTIRDKFVKEKYGNILAEGVLENGTKLTVSLYDHGLEANFRYSYQLSQAGVVNGYLSPREVELILYAKKKHEHTPKVR
jgi:hypothetical protein